MSMARVQAPPSARGRPEQGKRQENASGNPAGHPADVAAAEQAEPRPRAPGRRPGLESSAAHLVVQRWIDDATEQLSNMMHTCSLDVVDGYPDGLSESSVALLLGVTEQAINAETKSTLRKLKAGLHAVRLDSYDL